MFGPVLVNDPQTPPPPQKEPTVSFYEHTFQTIIRRKKKIIKEIFRYLGNAKIIILYIICNVVVSIFSAIKIIIIYIICNMIRRPPPLLKKSRLLYYIIAV